MSPRHRPAARVLCLDPAGRVLLLRWRDPAEGAIFWEPPGGGLEPGESPLAAARRELHEETGLPADAVLERSVVVQRDFEPLQPPELPAILDELESAGET